MEQRVQKKRKEGEEGNASSSMILTYPTERFKNTFN